MLIDAGPLVAVIDGDDPHHGRCVDVLRAIAGPYLTTWPALTEAMHLLHHRAGWHGQEQLWRLVRRGVVEVAGPDPGSVDRIVALMKQYRDTPMDLADATLVALAEERKITRVFTLDSDFGVYRMHGRRAFTVVP